MPPSALYFYRWHREVSHVNVNVNVVVDVDVDECTFAFSCSAPTFGE